MEFSLQTQSEKPIFIANMCCKGEKWIKSLQGRVKFVAVSFSVMSCFGLCILFVLYFAGFLPIAITQLVGKVVYVIMTVCLNVLLYQGARYKNTTYLTIWLVAVMIQNVITIVYGIYSVYLCTISSRLELVLVPILCFIFTIFHFIIWCLTFKFLKQVAREEQNNMDIQNEELNEPFKGGEIL